MGLGLDFGAGRLSSTFAAAVSAPLHVSGHLFFVWSTSAQVPASQGSCGVQVGPHPWGAWRWAVAPTPLAFPPAASPGGLPGLAQGLFRDGMLENHRIGHDGVFYLHIRSDFFIGIRESQKPEQEVTASLDPGFLKMPDGPPNLWDCVKFSWKEPFLSTPVIFSHVALSFSSYHFNDPKSFYLRPVCFQ